MRFATVTRVCEALEEGTMVAARRAIFCRIGGPRELLEQSALARLSDPVRLSLTLDASASEVPSI